MKDQLLLRSYISGFLGSLILTLASYTLISHHALNRKALITFISIFAFAQFITQMFFFLHLGQERKPRWKLLVFVSMVLVVAIVVVGSLWIMNNLNYNMSQQQMYQYINNQSDGL